MVNNILFISKNALKKTIHWCGFELHRVAKSTQPSIKSNKTKSLTFELMGPSGIGKTTFHRKISKNLNYRWNHKYSKHTKLKNSTLSDLDEFYRKSILLKSYNLFQEEKNFERQADVLTFFINRAEQDRYMKLSGLLDKGGAFLEDGFCHNFIDEIIEIIEKKLISQEVLEQFFAGRNFVFLKAPVDYVVDNLRIRQKLKRGIGNDLLSLFGEKLMGKYVQNEFVIRQRFMKLSTEYGARWWSLDINADDKENLKAIRVIESEIIAE